MPEPYASPIDLFDPIGLCQACRHARVVGNRHGSQFYLCQLSESDLCFPKYPRLPVLKCIGFEPDPFASSEDA